MLRHKWIFACAVAALSQAAVAQTASNNIDRAAEARDAGDYRAAIALLEVEQRNRPQDSLVLHRLGAVYAYNGEYEKAIQVLKQAQSIATMDRDIALMLARTFLWAGRPDEATAIASAIAHADPTNAELPQLRKAIAAAAIIKTKPPTRTVVNVSQALSDVATRNGSNRWHQTIVGLTVAAGNRATLSGVIDREDRTVAVDTRIGLRTDMNFGNARYAYVAASVTPNADFREKWGLRAGGEAGVAKTINLTADLRYAEYGATQIIAFEPGVRLHSADDRLSLAIKSINLWSEDDRHRSGWSVRGELQAKKSVRLVTGAATYPDTEAGITRRTRSAFAGAVVNLSERATLRIFYEFERRAQSYTRNGVALALSVQF